MTELTEEIVAIHEAGHAAVDLYFEHDLEAVSIDGEGFARGHVQVDRSGHDALRYEDELQKQVPFERAIMAALAGELAQRRFAPDSIEDEHAGGDRRLVHDYLDELDCPNRSVRDAYWRLLELRAEALVDRLWPAITRIAAALIAQRTITRDEAEAAFRGPIE